MSLGPIVQSIEILSKEKGIDPQIVLDAVKDAMLIAAKKHFRTNEDYVADLGGVRTERNDEVAHARSYVAMAARLAGVPALDMVTLDFGDDDRFVDEARQARALGYAGKLCIHPAQVALANEAFRPSADEVDRAHRLLTAFDSAGGMTIAFEGLMVDEVVAARARAILTAADDR